MTEEQKQKYIDTMKGKAIAYAENVLKGYDYVRLFAMYNNNFRLKDILKELGLELNPHTLYYALKRKTYLRWFSEEDFYEKVQTLSSQLPKKETYKNHKKIELKYGRQSQ